MLGLNTGCRLSPLKREKNEPAVALAHLRRGGQLLWRGVPDLAQKQPNCPAQLHFGEQDHAIPLEGVEKLKTAHPELAEAADFKPWLVQHLRWSLGGLEHHQVEDLHYFPVFRRAEPRLAAGFALLERDHCALHTAIGSIVERANVVLTAESTGGAQFRADLARFRDAHVALGRDLLRHLDDEEDLVIPLLLERGAHGFTGGA
jgi:hypothetical protein